MDIFLYYIYSYIFFHCIYELPTLLIVNRVKFVYRNLKLLTILGAVAIIIIVFTIIDTTITIIFTTNKIMQIIFCY